MKTLGVDLAAATPKTAAAVLEWSDGTARLAHLALDVGDEEIVRLFGSSDMTGIDCPVGWPDAFLPFLAGHLAFEPHPVLDHDGIAGRRLLAYRDTDRFVTARTGLIPLSVAADRLAHPAMRCAVIQAKIAVDYGPQARDGSGRLAEVYPAASLKSWGLLARGYKGRGEVHAEGLHCGPEGRRDRGMESTAIGLRPRGTAVPRAVLRGCPGRPRRQSGPRRRGGPGPGR